MKLSELQLSTAEWEFMRKALITRLKVFGNRVGVGNRIQKLINTIDNPTTWHKKELTWSDHCNLCGAFYNSKHIDEQMYSSMQERMFAYRDSIGWVDKEHWKIGYSGLESVLFMIAIWVILVLLGVL